MNPINKKIFVGNVPFNCTKEEFIECFKNMAGFVTADIIMDKSTNLTRGFGFVEFIGEDHALKLLNTTNMKLGNRQLRFQRYSSDNSQPKIKIYHVQITNIPQVIKPDELKRFLQTIDKGITYKFNFENNEVVCILSISNYITYQKLLSDNWQINGQRLTIEPFKRSISPKNKTYDDGFKAGQLVGYQLGFNQALQMRNN